MGARQKDRDYLGCAESVAKNFWSRFVKRPLSTSLLILGIIVFFTAVWLYQGSVTNLGSMISERFWDSKPLDTIPQLEPNKGTQSEKQLTDNIDTFFIKDSGYSGPKLKLLLAEPLDSTPFNGVYQAKLSLVMGVPAGEMEPILNNVVSPSGFDCLYDGIRRQPAVVVNGDLIGRVAYTYRINCTSKMQMDISNFKGFKFDYAY